MGRIFNKTYLSNPLVWQVLIKEGPNIAMVMWGCPHLAENKTLHLQSLLYATKPATVAELREAIEHECAQIPRELFHDVCDSIA